MVGTNCQLQNSWPAGYWERDLSVWRPMQCPLRNNLLQEQRLPQALLVVVTQLVRRAPRKRRNDGQEVKYHCSEGTPFLLSND
jgi:hypothetical protein